MARRAVPAHEQLPELGPQNEDELWEWFRDNLGIEFPRVAVCPDHVAPFDFIVKLCFFQVKSILAIANRTGGKTLGVAAVVYYLCELFPGYEAIIVGAIEAQAKRAYEHLKSWTMEGGEPREGIIRCIASITEWENGSKVEHVPGTVAAVNGPHPPFADSEEIELMEDPVWKESRNMAAGKQLKDGRYVPPMNVATSTMKFAAGRVVELKTEVEVAKSKGHRPPREVMVWCIYETAQQVPNCRAAKENEGRPECELCECNTVVKGTWENDQDRTLEQVCQGRLYRSRGYRPYEEIVAAFQENDRDTWESQIECKRGSTEGNYLPGYNRDRMGIVGYQPHPDNGPIRMSMDFGGTAPFAVNWYQILEREVIAELWVTRGRYVELPAGFIVCFAEIYRANIGNMAILSQIHAIEDSYRAKFGPDWEVGKRHPDPAARGAILDFQNAAGHDEHGRPLRPIRLEFKATREFDEHVKYARDIVNHRFAIDIESCPNWDREATVWKQRNGREVPKHNHCMANFRYFAANLRREEQLRKRQDQVVGSAPKAADDGSFEERAVATVGPVIRRTGVQREADDGPATAEDSPLAAEARRMPRSERWREDFRI